MAKGDKKNVTQQVTEIVEPIIKQLGLSLWDVEFKKEGVDWCLTIIIDKDGGVDLVDCENVSRAVDKPLDEADPIEQSYYLQVFSPGINRKLTKQEHFEKNINNEVLVLLIRPLDGQREYKGILKSYEKGQIVIECDQKQIEFAYKDASYIKLGDDIIIERND